MPGESCALPRRFMLWALISWEDGGLTMRAADRLDQAHFPRSPHISDLLIVNRFSSSRRLTQGVRQLPSMPVRAAACRARKTCGGHWLWFMPDAVATARHQRPSSRGIARGRSSECLRVWDVSACGACPAARRQPCCLTKRAADRPVRAIFRVVLTSAPSHLSSLFLGGG